MDVYDFTKSKLEKLNQNKLLIYSIIIASVLIIGIMSFLIYVNKAAKNGKHIFGFSQKKNEERIEEERKRQEKVLEDPEAKELYEKFLVERDLSF